MVSGKGGLGGLVGLMRDGGQCSGSFWDLHRSGRNSSAGGVGKSGLEMKDEIIYLAAGWDFAGESINGTEDF